MLHSVSAAAISSSKASPPASAALAGAAQESAVVIPAAVLSRFADEGFAFRGRVVLADLADAYSNTPLLRQRVKAAKEAGRAAAAPIQAPPPAGARAGAGAAAESADDASTAMPASVAAVPAGQAPPEGRVPDRPEALSALAAKAAEPRGMLDVAIVRVDSAGNLYTKT